MRHDTPKSHTQQRKFKTYTAAMSGVLDSVSRYWPRSFIGFLIRVVELVKVVVVTKPLGGYGDGPGDASGWRFSVGPGRSGGADSVAQPGAGIAATFAKMLAIAAAHGQLAGIRNLRRRPPVVSLAGTCRSR